MIHSPRRGPVLLLASVSACAFCFLCPQAVDATAGLLSELDGFGGEKALSIEAEFGSLEHDVPMPGASRELSIHEHHASRYEPLSSEIRWPSEGNKKSFSSKAERLSKRRRYYSRKKPPVSDDGGGRRIPKRKRIQKYEMLHGSSGRIPNISKHRSGSKERSTAPRWRKFKKTRNRYTGDKIEELAERSSSRRRYESASTSGSAEVPDKDSKEHVKRIKLKKNRNRTPEKEEERTKKTKLKEYSTPTPGTQPTTSKISDVSDLSKESRTRQVPESRSNGPEGNNYIYALGHGTMSSKSPTEATKTEKVEKSGSHEATSAKPTSTSTTTAATTTTTTTVTTTTTGVPVKSTKKAGFPIIHRGEDHLELIYQPPSASRRSPRIVIKGPVIAAPGLFKDVTGRTRIGPGKTKLDTTERIVFEAEVGGKILHSPPKKENKQPATSKPSQQGELKALAEPKPHAANVTTSSPQNETRRWKTSTENPMQIRSEAGEMMSRETDKGFQQFLKHFLEKKLFKAMNYLKQELRDIKEIQRKQLDPTKHHGNKNPHEGATASAERRGFLQTRSVAPHPSSNTKQKNALKTGTKAPTTSTNASSNSSKSDGPPKILLVQGKTSTSTSKPVAESKPRSTRNFEEKNKAKAADNSSSPKITDDLPSHKLEIHPGSSELPNLSNLSRIINNIVGLLSKATGSTPKPEPA